MSEYIAASALERYGYTLYLPTVKTPRPRQGHEDSPMFPGYLFVRHEQEGLALPPVNRIAGFIGWVQFDDVVPSVPDEVIRDLDRRLEQINQEGGHWTRFKPGDQVRVVAGPMDGLAQVLEEPKSPESRVRVLLSFMGGLVRARVPWQDLQPVDNEWTTRYRRGRPPRRTRGRGRWIRGFGPSDSAGAPSPPRA